ncbi:hypothetical protein SCLCIDRAFT_7202 [Scleroderma citrinum Foug A]|uniref:Uncharacterized protein n=1 Tax=Scleroderma citrinum Foug A TaxID=1036808 RepID=A0A0C3A4E3_9AGAM|nr:hypothetical protein SCLCIDRAFT_7202 [Scleroderma citrinum Foug A]
MDGDQYLEFIFTHAEFDALHKLIDESPGYLRKPKMSFFPDESILIVQCPSLVHEGPLEDMVLTVTSMRGPKVIQILFLIECAFSQGEKVFDQVKKEIAAHPELRLVIIILIMEVPKYQSPQKGSETWKYFEALGPLELDEFVDYYVWLREDPTDTLEGVSPVPVPMIQVDPEVEETEYSTHGVMPGNINMSQVHELINKGFHLIKNNIICFLHEIYMNIDESPECTTLEASVVSLPSTWDDFCSALTSASQVTAHVHYTEWYRVHWRSKKCLSRSHSDSHEENNCARKCSSHLVDRGVPEGDDE